MNAGVCTMPCASASSPHRASPSVALTTNFMSSPRTLQSQQWSGAQFLSPMRRKSLVKVWQRLDALLVVGESRRQELSQFCLGLADGHAPAGAEVGGEDQVAGPRSVAREEVAAQLFREVRELLAEPLAALRHLLLIGCRVALEEELGGDRIESLRAKIPLHLVDEPADAGAVLRVGRIELGARGEAFVQVLEDRDRPP